MNYHALGHTQVKVSEICLGTMTFGEQNTPEDACAQLDFAVSQGVNFIDTAEMYPVPGRAETQGRTEDYVGRWLKKQKRDQFILASKVTGPSRGFAWIRGGPKAVDHTNIQQAIEGSLRRLQTDYIDLYQIHWPDRYVPMFGQTSFEPKQVRTTVPIEEQLTVLNDLVQAGKVRYIGLSNETPWGVCEFVKIAEQTGLARIVSIQNAYSLLNRSFEQGLAEACYQEKVGLLAYSPLAFGMLSGKYQHADAQGRLTLFPDFGQRYRRPNAQAATAAYCKLAQDINLKPAVMALAFARTRPFMTSVIIGATNMAQLQENLSAVEVELNEETLREIKTIHQQYPNPSP